MDKKISIVDFYSSDALTAILTYAFLRKKEQSGYVLTEDEKDLLYNNVHKTFLSMALTTIITTLAIKYHRVLKQSLIWGLL